MLFRSVQAVPVYSTVHRRWNYRIVMYNNIFFIPDPRLLTGGSAQYAMDPCISIYYDTIQYRNKEIRTTHATQSEECLGLRDGGRQLG